MNEVWDLSILYKDFDDPAFTGDMKALDETIAAVNTLAGEAAGMEHSQLVHRFLQVQERVEALSGICHIEKRIESRLYWKRYIPPE